MCSALNNASLGHGRAEQLGLSSNALEVSTTFSFDCICVGLDGHAKPSRINLPRQDEICPQRARNTNARVHFSRDAPPLPHLSRWRGPASSRISFCLLRQICQFVILKQKTLRCDSKSWSVKLQPKEGWFDNMSFRRRGSLCTRVALMRAFL